MSLILNADAQETLISREKIEQCLINDRCTIEPTFLSEYRAYWLNQLKNADSNIVQCQAYCKEESQGKRLTLKPCTHGNEVTLSLDRLYGHLKQVDRIQEHVDTVIRSLYDPKILKNLKKGQDHDFLKCKSNYLKSLNQSSWFNREYNFKWGISLGIGLGIPIILTRWRK